MILSDNITLLIKKILTYFGPNRNKKKHNIFPSKYKILDRNILTNGLRQRKFIGDRSALQYNHPSLSRNFYLLQLDERFWPHLKVDVKCSLCQNFELLKQITQSERGRN